MELFKIFGSILINDKEALKSLSKAQQEAYKTEKKLNKMANIGERFKDVGKKMTTFVTLPMIAVGGAAFKVAADVQDSIGAVDKVFGNSSKEIHEWSKALPAYYGVSKAQALEHASVMGSMLKNIGGQTEEVASEQTQALVELAGDLSAMYGGGVEEALTAITSSLAGNNQAMKKYGTAILDADVKQKAFELGVYSGTGAMSAQAKQAGTLAIIMEQTADSQGQAGREADQASGSMKEFTTTVKNLASDIGEVLLPIVTPMIQKVSEWIQKFSNLDDKTKKIIVIVAGLIAALGPLLAIVGTAISVFASLSTIAVALGTSVGALVSPVALAVAAIAGIIAIGVTLWKNWDTIKTKLKELGAYFSSKWQGMKDTVSSVIESIKSTVRNGVEKVKSFLNFKWAFPKLKMPHFKVSGSMNPLNWIKQGVPKLGVEWYAKGGLMDTATIFGAGENSLMGGGEAGPEAILPLTSSVLGDIGKGISNTMNNSGTDVNALMIALKQLLNNMSFEIQDGGDSFKAIIDDRLLEVI